MEKKYVLFSYIRNLFAIGGVIACGYYVYLSLSVTKTCNYQGNGTLTRQTASSYLTNYATKYQVQKKGYFISRSVIERLLCDAKYTGIYVYPGLKNLNDPASVCIISEAGTSSKPLTNRESNTNPVFFSNENLCPEDCGSF